MGLNQANKGRHQAQVLAVWLLPIIISGIALIAAAFGDLGREVLSFLRPAIAEGEFWRLATGHFIHLGWPHLVLNLAGLMLVWYIVGAAFELRCWLIIIVATVVGMDIGFWFLEPQLLWYVGLSGLLHGLLAAGIVGEFRSGRVEVRVLGGLVIAKLVYEQLFGPLPGSEEASGGAVIVAAHAYGAVSGVIAAAIILIRVRARASI
jgi:rhomboid family GlyGly-CTERM serine protease